MPRLFTAVEVSEAVRGRAFELMARLCAADAEVKWVERDNLHVTLKFLGEVAAERVEKVCQTVVESVKDRASFEFELRGAGAFPKLHHANTLWVGIGEGSAEFDKLFRAVQRSLVALGFPRENRKFTPHLTLGRLKRGACTPLELGDLLELHADFAAGRSLAREVVVFESQLTPGGSIYRALCSAPLRCAE